MNTIFQRLWQDLTWVVNPSAMNCEVDALTTTPSRWFYYVCEPESRRQVFVLIQEL